MDERMVTVNKVFERVEGIKHILITQTNTVQVFLRLKLIYKVSRGLEKTNREVLAFQG